MICVLRSLVLALVLLSTAAVSFAQSGQVRVLWHDGNFEDATQKGHHRRRIATFLEGDPDNLFEVAFVSSKQPGTLATELESTSFDIIVVNNTARQSIHSREDLAALQCHYATGKRALMLDGRLWIRSTSKHLVPRTNGLLGEFMIDQLVALSDVGGRVLIGTDRDKYQVAANIALAALIPGAQFTGKTVPSPDGVSFGKTLLAHHAPLRPVDILNHWQTAPSQAEAPVGQFADFFGNPVALFSLVETADQSGGDTRRSYVCSTIDPGGEETAIDAMNLSE